MTVSTWLKDATTHLETAGIKTARLDCLVLLEDVLGKNRTHVLAHPETKLSNEQEKKLSSQIARRKKHEPLAYIRGKSEFYGREFLVNRHTLEPRPETETMIELLKKLAKQHDEPLVIADIGTGSGCIAITVKLELPTATVLATDIDKHCVEVARKNATQHGADVTIYEGNLLQPILSKPLGILLCNLPYVPTHHGLNQAAKHEPKHAIFGGEDGLDYYHRMFEQLENLQRKPAHIFTESLPPQHYELALLARKYNYLLVDVDDFIQLFTYSK